MPFHFSLQSLLHLRLSLEHQQELKLQSVNQLVARVRRLVERFEEQIGETSGRSASQLTAGTTSAEMRFELFVRSAAERQRQEAQRELVRLEKIRDDQQKIFQHARRQRQTLETLRDAQCREYDRARARRDQRVADELFLYLSRRKYPRG
jgi:flagellar export protein FliJ